MKNLAVFASGGGTNFQAIIDGIEGGEINAVIKLCIVSNARAYAGERAVRHNIPVYLFDKALHEEEEIMFDKIASLLIANQIDYIILAGYMTILPPSFTRRFKGKIINIHPSLIPKYCGKGFYGSLVHKAVLENRETESGLTVHFVDEGVDTGEIILQVKVPVLPNDTVETLSARVLAEEHQALFKVVQDLCS